MNNTTHQSSSSGHSSPEGRGGLAVLAEPSVLCSEAYSLNIMNSLGGGGLGSRAPSIYSESQTDASEVSEGTPSEEVSLENRRRLQIRQMGSARGLKVASLNMRGRQNVAKVDKWPFIWSMMRKNKVAILALQETHLTEDLVESLSESQPRLRVISNSRNAAASGIAFLLDPSLLQAYTWESSELIPDRASVLHLEHKDGSGFDIVNLYAPNKPAVAANFFESLLRKLGEVEVSNPIILGDFNFVEEAMDRAPEHPDRDCVVDAFASFKNTLQMIDGWRTSNPDLRSFTFEQATGSLSRIDRIYLREEAFQLSFNWGIVNSQTLSDHDMITVELLNTTQPYIGKGLKRLGVSMLEDGSFKKKASAILLATQDSLEVLAANYEQGSQELWAKTKIDILNLAERERKTRRQQLARESKMLSFRLKNEARKLTQPDCDTRAVSQRIRKLRGEQGKLQMANTLSLLRKSKMQYRTLGERCTKYFFGLYKERGSPQVISALERQDRTLAITTREMGQIASAYHEGLQAAPEMDVTRQQAIDELLELSTRVLSDEEREFLSATISQTEIADALRASANGSVPGIDGIPYEFYKSFKEPSLKERGSPGPDDEQPGVEGEEEEPRAPSMLKILSLVFQDIEAYGILDRKVSDRNAQNFTDGVMSLLYKKKSVVCIQNYRPITLLNADYKLYTKTMSNKLGIIAPTLIDEDQAGFVPKRSLFDHTKTTHTVVEYCELSGKNGCVVALDQEKAYDRIDHEYLWQVLRKNEFPPIFIRKVQDLYANTGKAVLLNGCVNRQYKVKRGVHQGDPLSCLLYNIAIEPLANALRASTLGGIHLGNAPRPLLVHLFADDTLVYLADSDDFQVLNDVLDLFCLASTAKFNTDKTEYLPVGSPNFRHGVIAQRQVGANAIPDGVRIVPDGEQLRTLGAWVGNKANTTRQWDEIIIKQQRVCDVWQKSNLSFKGKELILKALVQSRATFLATVNGLPKAVEHRMKKMYKTFLWNGKKGVMAWDQVITPRKNGGLAMPDLKSRAEAITAMWVKRWLAPTAIRPLWAYGVDAIIAGSAAKKPMVTRECRLSWVLQSWHESEASNVVMSDGIRSMLKTARRYNIDASAPKLNRETKDKWPLWFHKDISNNYLWNKKSSQHIRDYHGVTTIGDLFHDMEGCSPACVQMTEKLQNLVPDGSNPLLRTPKKVRDQGLELTPRRSKANMDNKLSTLFDPEMGIEGSPMALTRLFGTAQSHKKRRVPAKARAPAYRDAPMIPKKTSVATLLVKCGGEKTGIVGWYGLNDERNVKFCVDGRLDLLEANLIGLAWIGHLNKVDALTVRLDCKKIVTTLKADWRQKDNIDWIDETYRMGWKACMNILRQRTDTLWTVHTPKEKQQQGAAWDYLATALLEEGVGAQWPPCNTNFEYNGALLRTISQKTAYLFTSAKNSKVAKGCYTLNNVSQAIAWQTAEDNMRVDSEAIWGGPKKMCLPRLGDFFWKLLHGRIKCGSWFARIPNWADKQFCVCGEVEEIPHILLDCVPSAVTPLWEHVGMKWMQATGNPLPEITMPLILGLGASRVIVGKSVCKHRSQLLIDLVSLAAWTIWRNRNNRIFNEKEPSLEGHLTVWTKEVTDLIKVEFDAISLRPFEKREKAYIKFERKWAPGAVFASLGPGKNDRELFIHL